MYATVASSPTQPTFTPEMPSFSCFATALLPNFFVPTSMLFYSYFNFVFLDALMFTFAKAFTIDIQCNQDISCIEYEYYYRRNFCTPFLGDTSISCQCSDFYFTIEKGKQCNIIVQNSLPRLVYLASLEWLI